MKKWVKIVLIVFAVIAFFLIGKMFFLFPKPVINLITSVSNECGYKRGTSCPALSEECSCSGILFNEYNLLPTLFRPAGGGSKNYCFLGSCSKCECFLNGCPVYNASKDKVQCDVDINDI